MPKVTVLMSVYNGARYLKAAVDSVLNQTFHDWELLIFNDASADGTGDVIRSFTDPRIRHFENERNLGPAASSNRGLRLASCEYIARLDGDDIMEKSRLEKQCRFLDTHPLIAVVGSTAIFLDEDARPLRPYVLPTSEDSILFHFITGRNPLGHPFIMYRKKTVVEAGLYDESLRTTEDYDLYLRMILKGFRFVNLPEPLTYYRTHPGQLTSLQKALTLRNHYIAFHAFVRRLTGCPVDKSLTDRYLDILVAQQTPLLPADAMAMVSLFKSLIEKSGDGARRSLLRQMFLAEIWRPYLGRLPLFPALSCLFRDPGDMLSPGARLALLRKKTSQLLRGKIGLR